MLPGKERYLPEICAIAINRLRHFDRRSRVAVLPKLRIIGHHCLKILSTVARRSMDEAGTLFGGYVA